MRQRIQRRSLATSILLASSLVGGSLLAGGCSGGSGSGTAAFAVKSLSVQDAAVWRINRPIDIEFTQDVDPTSVSLNSIHVRELNGVPVIGTFELLDARTVRFQPRCPTLPDFSDAGFQVGGRLYEIIVIGTNSSTGIPVRSSGGSVLSKSENRRFLTPTSTAPGDLFFDTQTGPPTPVIRALGSTEEEATHLQIGGDPSNRIYFERDPSSGAISLEGGGRIPLNLFSDNSSQVAMMLVMDQPVSPSANNFSSAALRWEFQDENAIWQEVEVDTTLVENCTVRGATIKLDPQGILPVDADMRAIVTTQFADLTGDSNIIDLTGFAIAETEVVATSLQDELLESFLVGGPGSLHDTQAVLADPPANWDNGELAAAFDFGGTGGPGGDFDFEVPAGIDFVFDTTSQAMTGGPNFLPTTVVTAVGGVVNVRNMRIGDGAVLKFIGPNPVTILVSGKLEIFGRIEVTGNSSIGVVNLNSTNIPEPGAAGQCGGGDGGDGSPLTNSSSPQGARGQGPFGIADTGGEGGETGAGGGSTSSRRPGGGGGGVFGRDQLDPVTGQQDESQIGLNAEDGFPGSSAAFGALDPAAMISPPRGGVHAPSPFIDGIASNDFWGLRVNATTQTVEKGELNNPFAGSGGGGGGDAANITSTGQFPVVPFNTGGDEKGGGGGGGGGALTILTIGDIYFGPLGRITVRGGTGGGGENTGGIDRVGGGSGGGAGGHLILQTASVIDLRDSLAGVGTPKIQPAALDARGGQGGAGAGNVGGATAGAKGSLETTPSKDACPDSSLGCLGNRVCAGGDGGPGIIQLHTPTGAAGILVPTSGQPMATVSTPLPLDDIVPIFGRTSAARSVWIPLGEGGHNVNDPADPFNLVSFNFAGTDTATGDVLTAAGVIPMLAPVLPATTLQVTPALPSISASDAFTVDVDAASVTYGLDVRANPSLLEQFILVQSQVGVPSNSVRHTVASASYDATGDVLSITVDGAEGPLTAFAAPGGVDISLVPTYFRVTTDGQLDQLPTSAQINIQFEVAEADSLGNPDPATILTSADPAVLNAAPNNRSIRFFRFVVSFDIDAQAQGLQAGQPLPSLRHLRVPFEFIDTSPSPIFGGGSGSGAQNPVRRLAVPKRF